MKDLKTIRSFAIALAAIALWGNVVSFLLPAEEHSMIVKTVDFATILFLLAILITAIIGTVKERRNTKQKEKPDSK